MKLYNKLRARLRHLFKSDDRCPCGSCSKWRRIEAEQNAKRTEKGKKVKKKWTDTKTYKDFYCAYIENGQEVIDKVACVRYKQYYDGTRTKELYFAGGDGYVWGKGKDGSQVRLLGKKVDRETELRYLNDKLKRKVKNQGNEIKMLEQEQTKHNKRISGFVATEKKLKEERPTAEEIKEYVSIATKDPSIGMLSEDPRTRKFVTIIYKAMKGEKE